MLGRLVATGTALFLAFYAFAGDGLGGGHVLNPSGIAFLALAGCVWFGWGPIRAAFLAAKDESNLPIIRLGSAILRGMRRAPPVRRSSGERG